MECILVDLSELQQYFARWLDELHVLDTRLKNATGKIQTVVPVLKGRTTSAKRQQPMMLPRSIMKMFQKPSVRSVVTSLCGNDGLHFPRRLTLGDLLDHFGDVITKSRNLSLLSARIVEGVATHGLALRAPELPDVVTGFLRQLGVHAPSKGVENMVV